MTRRLTRRRFLELAASAALAAGCRAPTGEPSPVPETHSNNTPEAAPPETESPRPEATSPALAVLQPAPDHILITSNDKFYKQSFATVPEVDAATWQLTLDGLVEEPLTLTLDDLKARPAVEVMRTLECISNPVGGVLIGNAVWKGTYLKPLLDEAGLRPEAARIKFEAADHYTTAVEIKFIDDERSFLAYEMNGGPLPPEHGFPVRIFFPGSYGQKMPKWVTRMEVIDYDYEGYWEERGWSDVAQVKTNSIIKQPYTGGKLGPGHVPVWGVAYAGKRDIVKVEVKVGEEDWREASLLHGPTHEAWTQWSLDWLPATNGNYKISVRATDDSGFTQFVTAGLLDGFPDGSDAIHSIYVKVV